MTRIGQHFTKIVALSHLVAAVLVAAPLRAAELQMVLPLARTAYQTNEWIDISVVRQGAQPLAAGDLILKATSAEGSQLEFVFPVPAVPVQGADARATEHVHLNGRLLRPGHYMLAAAADGASAKAEIDLYSHIRQSSFRLVNWGTAKGPAQLAEGEDSLGFNLFYGHYGQDEEGNFIRAGLDFMSNCTMSGGHQMDLRTECDWSDPLVIRGGTRRVTRRAMQDRTRPNVPGVHFYDEPGLTWTKNPHTGEFGPHGVPGQVRSFKSAFGQEPLSYHLVKPDNAEHVRQWRQWAIWKLGFMDAAWKDAQFGVSYVRPDYLSVTQSQYGFSAYTDGYYFNVVRSLPITSGHGGYDDYGPGYFNPSYTLEMARARDFAKPCWYLPTWYGNTPAERFRMEQYLSFMTNLQGMISPPDIDPFQPGTKPAAEGVVESNKLMARLGTIFTTMPVTRPPVAVLYSLSQNIHAQTRDMQANYTHSHAHGQKLPFVYLAGKMLQQQFLTVVEEDIIDGTLAAEHRAVILTSIQQLDPKVVTALEQYIVQGGLVLLTGDCTIAIKGAINLEVTPDFPDAAIVKKLMNEKKYQDAAPFMTVGKFLEGARPLAAAIKARLDKAGIKPVFACDQPGIVASRQATGDIEYLFAVNATYDPAVGGLNAHKATVATIGLAADGRPVYDAVLGGSAAGFNVTADLQSGEFRFGPGQMRVFARTTRPIGSVQALTPVVKRELTKAENPLTVEIAAVLPDEKGRVIAGSAPLEIHVIDPLGAIRHHVYRATDQGAVKVSLPLAINDPPGEWRVVVRELLKNTEDTATFQLAAPPQCGALAGATGRAVSFGNESDNVFRFFRVHQDVTLVTGKSDFNQVAAQRLIDALRPWEIRCKVVTAEEVNKPRELTEEEAATWVGLDYAGSGQIKPGRGNSVQIAGFDIRGPVVLLGNPVDNPLIDFLQKQRFLPFQPDANIPGRGRGMFAWQRDGIGALQESITLIAYDAAGMDEAVGSLFEAAAGIEPLTRFVPPQRHTLSPASSLSTVKELPLAWQTTLPDRAAKLKLSEDGQVAAVTWDGSLFKLNPADGKLSGRQDVAANVVFQKPTDPPSPAEIASLEAAKKHAPANRIVKFAVQQGDRLAIGYWGGTLQVRDGGGKLLSSQLLPQDITGLIWSKDRLIVGQADGRIVVLAAP